MNKILVIISVAIGFGLLIFLSTQFNNINSIITASLVTPTVANITTAIYTANGTIINGQALTQSVLVGNMAGWGLFMIALSYIVYVGIKQLGSKEGEQ